MKKTLFTTALSVLALFVFSFGQDQAPVPSASITIDQASTRILSAGELLVEFALNVTVPAGFIIDDIDYIVKSYVNVSTIPTEPSIQSINDTEITGAFKDIWSPTFSEVVTRTDLDYCSEVVNFNPVVVVIHVNTEAGSADGASILRESETFNVSIDNTSCPQ